MAAVDKVGFFSRALAALALFTALVSTSGCGKFKARDLLNKGVQAVQAHQYDTAIEDFKQAIAADPSLLDAHYYLAATYAQEYYDTAPSDENARMGQQAIIEFQNMLSLAPNDLRAIDGLAKLFFLTAGNPLDPTKLEESKKYYLQHIALKSDDFAPYYFVALIDDTLAYGGDSDLRSKYNQQNLKKQIRQSDPLPDSVRADFAQQYGSIVDEGLQMITKVRSLNADDTAVIKAGGPLPIAGVEMMLLRQKADESDKATRDSLEKQADAL